jgi:hypothetical protein
VVHTCLNAYRDGTVQSVVIYLDILGYKETVKRAYAEGKEASLLQKLRTALTEAKSHLDDPTLEYHKRKQWESTLFTDNLVIGIPIFFDGEDELGLAFLLAGMFQFSLAKHGFVIRGAIVVGDLFMTPEIIFGEALLQAYQIESTDATNPRIVLAPSAVSLVEKHLCYYGTVRSSPQSYHLLVDVDGQMFVNYLLVPLDGYPADEGFLQQLRIHKNRVEENLAAFKNQPRSWGKYAWSGTYHNFACTLLCPQNEVLKINAANLQPNPRPLRKLYAKRQDASVVNRDSGKVIKWQPWHRNRPTKNP